MSHADNRVAAVADPMAPALERQHGQAQPGPVSKKVGVKPRNMQFHLEDTKGPGLFPAEDVPKSQRFIDAMRKLRDDPSQKRSASFLALGCLFAVILLAFAPRLDVTIITSFPAALSPVKSPFFAINGPNIEVSRAADDGQYLLGVGKADITGPVVEIGFMGYANGSQVGSGLRQRLYARSFIIGELNNPSSSIVYTVLDTQSGDIAIRNGILEGLAAKGGDYARYAQSNVAIVGTHSHSGPGAWLNYFLPQVTTRGFDKQSYQAIVDGVVLSIQRAHESLAPGSLSFGTTRLEDANINRSLFAYLANPEDERAQYDHDSVDKELSLLRLTRTSDQADIGLISWFPVHGTSMLGNNTLVTGDNKGVAAALFEKSHPTPGFVAGFSQANVGDTSPNVNGAFCEGGEDDGKECSLERSLCAGRNEPCHGRGPHFGLNDAGTASAFEIGRRQSNAAQSLISSNTSLTVIGGPVRSVYQNVDMSNYTFTLPNGTVLTTCSAALGYSFAAGTTDGPGAFDFKQNDTSKNDTNPLWKLASHAIHNPSKEQVACQAPKPILLDAGATTFPYQWAPNIAPVQLLRVGQLYIIVSPGEATTMSGRRWKAALAASVSTSSSDLPPIVVLGAPANSYTHYIATPEEYQVQRYEGASTLYGPNTLPAYIMKSIELLPYLSKSPPPSALSPGPDPPDNRDKSLSFITPVIYDSAGLFHSFGDVTIQPLDSYIPGSKAITEFRAANPRNNLRLEGTYAAIQVLREGQWTQWKDDSDWELIFEWYRSNFVSDVLGESRARITWEVPEDAPRGVYRVAYFGDSKGITGVKAFEGYSHQFAIA